MSCALQKDRRQISSAVQASIESAQAEHAQRASAAAAAEEDEAEQQPAFTGPSHWAAAAGSSGAAQIRPEDFPALPGTQLGMERCLAPNPGLWGVSVWHAFG